MDNHDGILTLLGIPDPIEKGLALKSKLVEPYHLRHALQDADAHIRAQAAAHPNLTRELMREILSGDDKDLKHIVLKRHDIDEHELGLVATDPDHALEVARHPKTTDAIRQKVLDHNHIPEGVKVEHQHRLSKSIGHITYPLLGEGKVYTDPMALTSGQTETRAKYHKNPKMAEGNLGFMSYSVGKDKDAGIPGERRVMSGVNRWATHTRTPAAFNATNDHEAQHSVFGRIAQKHGQNARARVVATTLSKLPEDQRNHIKSLFTALNTSSGTLMDPEESITYLHNYLQDPVHRSRVHEALGFHTAEEQRDSRQKARQAWNGLRRIGMSLRPEDVGINPKAEADRMARWVKKLSKRESIPSDQLGFSVSFHELIAIAQFLTQQQVDLSVVRQALMANGGDPRDAVLTAYGLNTPEGKKAFDNVKQLKLHKTEDVLKAPKSIVGIDNEDMAAVVQKAYKDGQVEPIALGGKHSSGSYIIKDEKGNNWLLKPGSGKKSPAAGVDETKGSQSRREAAFSALAKLLEIHEVKPAHLLSIDSKEVASIQMWPMDWTNLHRTMYEDANIPRRALDRYLRNGKLFRWSVLDFIAGNPDRHGNNLMVSSEEDGNKIGLIDHGSAFAGHHFDPGNDKDSFVPYYLRVWAGPEFHGLESDEQLDQMPKLTGEADQEFREWVEALDPKAIEAVLHKYGIEPSAVLARLKEIQSNPMAENMSQHINLCWLVAPAQQESGQPS